MSGQYTGACREATKSEMAVNAVFQHLRHMDHILHLIAEQSGQQRSDHWPEMVLEYTEMIRGQFAFIEAEMKVHLDRKKAKEMKERMEAKLQESRKEAIGDVGAIPHGGAITQNPSKPMGKCIQCGGRFQTGPAGGFCPNEDCRGYVAPFDSK